VGYAHFFAGRYDQASQAAEAALSTRPNYLTGLSAAAAAHALAGRADQAHKLMARMRQLDPKLRLSNLPDLLPFRRRQDFNKWADALSKAGLPE